MVALRSEALRVRLPDERSLFSRQGAETPAAGILEYGPPGYPSVGSPQAPLFDLVDRGLRHRLPGFSSLGRLGVLP